MFRHEVPLIVPELEWMLIGEKLARGFIMYRDVWYPLEPFSAGAYWIIVSLIGKNQYALELISIGLVFIQALFCNLIANNAMMYKEKNTFPALLYILFANLFFDFYSLSPVLLGLTFMFPALYFALIQIKFRLANETMLYIGILIGIASLFYLPFIFFLLVFIASFLFFSAGSIRKYFLLLCGFGLPITFVALYYSFNHGLDDLISTLIDSYLTIPARKYTEYRLMGIISLVPMLLTLFSFGAITSISAYIHFQYNVFKLVIFWLACGIFTLFISLAFSPFQLLILAPALAYLGSHYFMLAKKKWPAEISFWILIIGIALVNFIYLRRYNSGADKQAFKALVVTESKNKPSVSLENKKILVVGYEPGLYKQSALATPFLSWDLSSREFLNLNNFRVLSTIYKGFQNDMPDVIIDNKGIMESVFFRIPVLAKEYEKLENENVWVLRK